MRLSAFNNYMNTILNALDANCNEHPEAVLETFNNQGKWALHTLERAFADKDQNIRHWLNGESCIVTLPGSRVKLESVIGDDREALFYFLLFCKKVNANEEIDEDFAEEVERLIRRSNSREVWEEC